MARGRSRAIARNGFFPRIISMIQSDWPPYHYGDADGDYAGCRQSLCAARDAGRRITAVGGGILRDLMAQRMPAVLYKDIYATPSAGRSAGRLYCLSLYRASGRWSGSVSCWSSACALVLCALAGICSIPVRAVGAETMGLFMIIVYDDRRQQRASCPRCRPATGRMVRSMS